MILSVRAVIFYIQSNLDYVDVMCSFLLPDQTLKLTFSSILPIVALIIVSGMQLSDRVQQRNHSDRIAEIIRFSIRIGKIINA